MLKRLFNKDKKKNENRNTRENDFIKFKLELL